MPNLAYSVVLLAAGASRRMRGEDKLLRAVDGTPLLRHVALRVLESSAAEVIVVLRPEDAARRAAVSGLQVVCVQNPDWQAGLSASLAAGIRAVSPQSRAAAVVLADMPLLAPGLLDALFRALSPDRGLTIARAEAEDGTPGHPVMFARSHFPALCSLGGDRGAGGLLARLQGATRGVVTRGKGAVLDLDTPEDWAIFESRTPDA